MAGVAACQYLQGIYWEDGASLFIVVCSGKMKERRQKVLMMSNGKKWGQKGSGHRFVYRLHPWKFFKPQQIKPSAIWSELDTDPTLSMKLEWRPPEGLPLRIILCFCDSSICHEVCRYSESEKREHKHLCLIWSQIWWEQPRWLCRKQSVSLGKAHWREKGTSIMQVIRLLTQSTSASDLHQN